MTPPAHDHVLDVGSRALPAASPARRWTTRGIVVLGEAWGIIAVAWMVRLISQTSDPAVMFFGIAFFAGSVIPESRAAQLVPDALFDLKGTLLRIVIAFAVTSAAITLLDLGDAALVLVVAVATFPAVMAGRSLTCAFWRRAIARNQPRRIAVVGDGEEARRILAALRAKGGEELELAGVIAMDTARSSGAPHLGEIDDIPRLVRSGAIDGLIVAGMDDEGGELVGSLRSAMREGVQVWVVPRLPQLPGRSHVREHLFGVPLSKLTQPAHEGATWTVKIAVERLIAALALILFAPVLALIALAIYLDSGLPILFRQERVGRGGKTFIMLKFRTMHDHLYTEWGTDATKITRVGKVLRDVSLDELPQLFNILRGDMALVGPRPECPRFVEAFEEEHPRYAERHRLPGGLTGLSQVNGLRGETSIEPRVWCDNYYIDNWSLEEDLKIVLRTITAVKKG